MADSGAKIIDIEQVLAKLKSEHGGVKRIDVEESMAKERKMTELRESERRRATAEEEDGVAYLAGIISKKAKRRIRLDMENDSDFLPDQHMWLGRRVRNELRGAGFVYDSVLMDGLWFSWLWIAVTRPRQKIRTSLAIRRKIWKYHVRSFLHYPVGKWGLVVSAYVISLGVSLAKARTEPLFVVLDICLILAPLVILWDVLDALT